jgi:hypothetical protein
LNASPAEILLSSYETESLLNAVKVQLPGLYASLLTSTLNQSLICPIPKPRESGFLGYFGGAETDLKALLWYMKI